MLIRLTSLKFMSARAAKAANFRMIFFFIFLLCIKVIYAHPGSLIKRRKYVIGINWSWKTSEEMIIKNWRGFRTWRAHQFYTLSHGTYGSENFRDLRSSKSYRRLIWYHQSLKFWATPLQSYCWALRVMRGGNWSLEKICFGGAKPFLMSWFSTHLIIVLKSRSRLVIWKHEGFSPLIKV